MRNKNTFKYKIIDFDKFKDEFIRIVDTTIDCNCNSVDPSEIKVDYFGKFESNQFTIYHKRCDIMIFGSIKEQELTIEFNFPNRYNAIFDIILFTLVGISIMCDINFYLGLAICLFVIIQKLIFYFSEEKRKKEFLKKMDEICRN
jgi:hypothetical protein